jgi:Flp pilus assembly pilin Flp
MGACSSPEMGLTNQQIGLLAVLAAVVVIAEINQGNAIKNAKTQIQELTNNKQQQVLTETQQEALKEALKRLVEQELVEDAAAVVKNNTSK